MEYLILGGGAILFLISLIILHFTRYRLVIYTRRLSDTLDAMISGHGEINFSVEEETLMGKLQSKLQKLYEILNDRASQNEADRHMLESTVADLSHQVKTPIASIRMYHELLEKENLDADRRRTFMSAAEQQVDKLEFLIQSMIKMSRLETGIVKVHPIYAPVYPLVEQAVCDVALKAGEKQIEIEVSCDESVHAYFDPKWTQEAVFNILDNAVKYTDSKGNIWITVQATAFFVRISIRDTGKGIEESRLTEVFKRFYREPEAAQAEGVGIGLYLAREIMARQRGFIEVQSEKGVGSVFSVHIPIEGE